MRGVFAEGGAFHIELRSPPTFCVNDGVVGATSAIPPLPIVCVFGGVKSLAVIGLLLRIGFVWNVGVVGLAADFVVPPHRGAVNGAVDAGAAIVGAAAVPGAATPLYAPVDTGAAAIGAGVEAGATIPPYALG